MNNFKVREMVQKHRAALMATVTAMLCTAMTAAPALANATSEITSGVTQGLGKVWEIFTGIALPVAAIALAVCGVSVIVGNERSTEAAKKTAIRIVVGMLLYDFATNIDIPVAVAGHNDNGNVSFKLYTGFERASSTEKYRLAQMVPGGRNRDGMAINMASAMLEKRQEEIRMMIIISDGQPNSYAYSGKEAARDIQEIIGKLRRKNIEVLAAGIGEDRERVKEIYGNDNYIDISDLSALPKILTNVVRKKVYAAM